MWTAPQAQWGRRGHLQGGGPAPYSQLSRASRRDALYASPRSQVRSSSSARAHDITQPVNSRSPTHTLVSGTATPWSGAGTRQDSEQSHLLRNMGDD